jgi:serine/threonine-protein phosphatase PP1 catalytic subunit
MTTEGEVFDPESTLRILLASRNRLRYFPFVYISESYIMQLCQAAVAILLQEPSVLSLTPPLTVCGDTHGQFTDTLRILEVIGSPDSTQYLFLGDYVDRGAQSIENMILLLTLKVLHPASIFLLRGNHETEEISTIYGLRDECLKRYSFPLYSYFLRVFEAMPIAATIADTIFCVHGGISSEKCDLETLQSVQRPLDPNSSPMVTDLLWSDPSDSVRGFVPSPRGVSSLYGRNEAASFLKKNGLKLIVRSHEFCQEGMSCPFGRDGGVLTVFSASNYCGTMNTSAVVTFNEELVMHLTFFQIQQT